MTSWAFIKDIQNPNCNQLNIMPVVEFQNGRFKFGVNFNSKDSAKLLFAFVPSYGTGSEILQEMER